MRLTYRDLATKSDDILWLLARNESAHYDTRKSAVTILLTRDNLRVERDQRHADLLQLAKDFELDPTTCVFGTAPTVVGPAMPTPAELETRKDFFVLKKAVIETHQRHAQRIQEIDQKLEARYQQVVLDLTRHVAYLQTQIETLNQRLCEHANDIETRITALESLWFVRLWNGLRNYLRRL